MARFSVSIPDDSYSGNANSTVTVPVEITSLDDWKGTVTMTYTLGSCSGGTEVFAENYDTTLVHSIYLNRNQTKTDNIDIILDTGSSATCTMTASGEAFGEVHEDSCTVTFGS